MPTPPGTGNSRAVRGPAKPSILQDDGGIKTKNRAMSLERASVNDLNRPAPFRSIAMVSEPALYRRTRIGQRVNGNHAAGLMAAPDGPTASVPQITCGRSVTMVPSKR